MLMLKISFLYKNVKEWFPDKITLLGLLEHFTAILDSFLNKIIILQKKYRWTINKNIILKTDFVLYLAGNVFNAYEQGWEPSKVCRIVAEKQSFKNSH